MPTIQQLPQATQSNATDAIPVSQNGVTRSVTVQNLLASTQSAITASTSTLLGRVSLGPGGPEPIPLGVGVTVTGGSLSATGADHATFVSRGVLSPTDEVVLNASGTPARMPLSLLRGLFAAGGNVSVDGNGVISATTDPQVTSQLSSFNQQIGQTQVLASSASSTAQAAQSLASSLSGSVAAAASAAGSASVAASSFGTSLTALAGTLSSQGSTLASHATSLSSLGTTVAAASSAAGSASAAASAASALASSTSTSFTALAGTLSSQGTQITSLSGSLGTQASSLTSLVGSVSTQGSTLASHATSLSSLGTTAAAASSAAGSASAAASAAAALASSTGTSLTALAGTVSTQATTLASHTTSLSSLGTTVAAASSAAGSATSIASAAQSAVSASFTNVSASSGTLTFGKPGGATQAIALPPASVSSGSDVSATVVTINNSTVGTASALTRALAPMRDDVVNVVDCGADPTNATNSTAAFNLAFQRALALAAKRAPFGAGVTIYVPGGVYGVGQLNWTIPSSSSLCLSLVGDGMDCTALNLYGTTGIKWAAPTLYNTFKMRGFSLYCSNSSQMDAAIDVSWPSTQSTNAVHAVIEDINIIDQLGPVWGASTGSNVPYSFKTGLKITNVWSSFFRRIYRYPTQSTTLSQSFTVASAAASGATTLAVTNAGVTFKTADQVSGSGIASGTTVTGASVSGTTTTLTLSTATTAAIASGASVSVVRVGSNPGTAGVQLNGRCVNNMFEHVNMAGAISFDWSGYSESSIFHYCGGGGDNGLIINTTAIDASQNPGTTRNIYADHMELFGCPDWICQDKTFDLTGVYRLRLERMHLQSAKFDGAAMSLRGCPNARVEKMEFDNPSGCASYELVDRNGEMIVGTFRDNNHGNTGRPVIVGVGCWGHYFDGDRWFHNQVSDACPIQDLDAAAVGSPRNAISYLSGVKSPTQNLSVGGAAAFRINYQNT